MAKSKADLQKDRDNYYQHLTESRAAHAAGDCLRSLDCAARCLDYIDGMMRYERKYEDKEFLSIEAIDVILNEAPFFLHYQLLDRVEEILESKRLIEKHTSADLDQLLSEARQVMQNAYRLWDHVERNPGVRQDLLEETLGWTQDAWQRLSLRWSELELLERTPEGETYRLHIRDPFRESTLAKCPTCGVVAKATKHVFLQERTCPKCKRQVLFVLVPDNKISANKE